MKQLPLFHTTRRLPREPPMRLNLLQPKKRRIRAKVAKMASKPTPSSLVRRKRPPSFGTRSDAAKWYVESHISALPPVLDLTYSWLHMYEILV